MERIIAQEFRKKGWNLYTATPKVEGENLQESAIINIMMGGRQEFIVKYQHYVPFPAVKHHHNPEEVMNMVYLMENPPSFVDIIGNENSYKPVGVYPIDSIVYDNNLNYVIARNLDNEKEIEDKWERITGAKMKSPNVVVEYEHIVNSIRYNVNRFKMW